jgi:preprotein translocase subunit SecB
MSVPSSKTNNKKEPTIQVRIKPRAKDHPSDDFKIVVNYKVALSQEEQENLKNLVPASPMIKRRTDGYNQL